MFKLMNRATWKFIEEIRKIKFKCKESGRTRKHCSVSVFRTPIRTGGGLCVDTDVWGSSAQNVISMTHPQIKHKKTDVQKQMHQKL